MQHGAALEANAGLYSYQLWGERVTSDLPWPELLAWSGPNQAAAITIRRGPVEAVPAGVIWQDAHAQLAAAGWFQVIDPGIAHYRGQAGRLVTIDPLAAPDDQEWQAFLRAVFYGTVLGGLALQRGLLPLHATSVVVGDRAILLLGERGSGKSSLAAALWRRGGAILADDLSAVQDGPDGIRILPGFPGLRLAPAMADALALPISADVPRYGHRVMLSPMAPACPRPTAPVLAVHLCPDATLAAPCLTLLTGLAAAALLHRNIFRFRLAEAMGRNPVLFATCVRAAAAIPHHVTLRYPPDVSGLDGLASMILDLL